MKKLILFFAIFFFALFISAQEQNIAIVIHGGAGYITPESLPADKQKAYQRSLQKALKIGYDILKKGGTSEGAVEAVILFLENDTLFNAGRGAVLTGKGTVSLDASFMEGSRLQAGAVAGVSRIRNPISAAIAVKNHSKHVMLSGTGAEEFAEKQGLQMTDPQYFIMPGRVKQLKKMQAEESEQGYFPGNTGFSKFGTVGCVALDRYGNIAAGTSTGGMMNKKYGRIGDSPIIGAGTYADNTTCGVSCTGHGEYFIRLGVAKQISDLMKYKAIGLQQAAEITIREDLTRLGGTGGIIAIDKDGNIVIVFNTPGMFRAWQKQGEQPRIKLFEN